MILYIILVLLVLWQTYLTYLIIKIRTKKEDVLIKSDIGFRAGLVKFNPFEGVGSNQSFCMALLANNKSGIIFTSLHGRNGTRVYARQVDINNLSAEKLSVEEKEAIKKALSIEESNK